MSAENLWKESSVCTKCIICKKPFRRKDKENFCQIICSNCINKKNNKNNTIICPDCGKIIETDRKHD